MWRYWQRCIRTVINVFLSLTDPLTYNEVRSKICKITSSYVTRRDFFGPNVQMTLRDEKMRYKIDNYKVKLFFKDLKGTLACYTFLLFGN